MAIRLYAKGDTNFARNGLGLLTPTECTVTEEANGMYEAQMSHPVDDAFTKGQMPKWRRIERGAVLSIPVPVRTLPEIVYSGNEPQIVTRVERWRATESIEIHQKGAENSPTLFTLAEKKDWIVTLQKGDWFKGRAAGGREGWAHKDKLTYIESITTYENVNAIEGIAPPGFSREQLFRVYRASWEDDKVTVYARHISYDHAKNLVGDCEMQNARGYEALRQIEAALYVPDDGFECFTDIKSRKESADWTRINPIKAMLDPDIGFCDVYGAQMVRDNFSIYLLKEAGEDRGFKIEQGKNMLGIRWEENEEDVKTRLVPVGQDEDGKPLLLPEVYIDSVHIGDYQCIACDSLDVPDAVVNLPEEGEEPDEDTVTQDTVYAMLREAAQAEYAKGVDLPTVSLSIDFINLGDTEEYKQFKQLLQIYMHDYVIVRHKRLGINLKLRMVKALWDPLAMRYTGIELSTKGVDVSKNRIASWQVPKDVEGKKIRAKSIGSAQLADGAASGSALKAGSVKSEAIASGAIQSRNIGTAAVASRNVADNAIQNRHIASGALDQAKVAGLPETLQDILSRLTALE